MNIEKGFENVVNNENNNKSNLLHSMKMATAVSVGLLAGQEGIAQTIPVQDSASHSVEITDNKAIEAISDLRVVLESAHIGDPLIAYENKIDGLISQGIKFSPEDIQQIFNIIIHPYEQFSKESSHLHGDDKLNKTESRLKLINKKLFRYLYQGEKSPFSELEGKLSFHFNKSIDCSLPDIDGRKIFNLVFNQQFNYDKVDISYEEKDENGEVVSGRYDMYKGGDDAGANIVVRCSISDGLIEEFRVIVRKDDQEMFYNYLLLPSADKSTNLSGYDSVRNLFVDNFKDNK